MRSSLPGAGARHLVEGLLLPFQPRLKRCDAIVPISEDQVALVGGTGKGRFGILDVF